MRSFNGLAVPSSLEDLCDPARMALLVYDMQAGITSQMRDGARIVERAGRALEAARGAGMRVVFTRHLSMPKPWMGVTQVRTAMAWQRTEDPDTVRPWFLRDSPGWAIVPALAPRPEEAVFDKLAMSAFEGTPLAFALHDCGITAVAIVGIATEIGIEPTCRHATDLGFIPVVLEDGCGAGHHEAGHAALNSMRFMGEVVLSDVDSFAHLLERRAT
ncbi:MAG TPA: cysteine hydrolase [Rubellimicrobium sp.]|nr:cysteine hydrolase [Rubellimicrobium sp.]